MLGARLNAVLSASQLTAGAPGRCPVARPRLEAGWLVAVAEAVEAPRPFTGRPPTAAIPSRCWGWPCCGSKPGTRPAPRPYRQAADRGDIFALGELARLREQAGDTAGDEAAFRQAANHCSVFAVRELAPAADASRRTPKAPIARSGLG